MAESSAWIRSKGNRRMTLTATPPTTATPQEPPRARRRLVALVMAAVLAAGGLGTGLALSLGGSGNGPASASSGSAYSYYRSVIGRYSPGGMMGGSYGSMTGPSGYSWMMGAAGAPGWMTGGSLPGFMMGASTDPGTVMGQLFADAPGPRVSASQATALGNQIPVGASVDTAANRISFDTQSVSFAVLASPSMPDESFRSAGMTNPTVSVPVGSHVSIELINADTDMAHGLVITAAGAASSWMPMMSAPPVFDGAAVWFLGEATSSGMHEATLDFTASAPGTYQYLCPVPGHAQKGMVGAFVVRPNS